MGEPHKSVRNSPGQGLFLGRCVRFDDSAACPIIKVPLGIYELTGKQGRE